MAVPISNLSSTWANTDNTFTGFGLNVNASAYAANSQIANFKLNSNSIFSISPQGATAIGARGSAPSPAAIIDLWAKDKGLLFPRMSTSQRDAISAPPNGLVIYNESIDLLQIRRAGVWSNVGDVVSGGGEGNYTFTISNTLFVSLSGSDSNPGTSEFSPFLTIEKAIQVATSRADPTIIKIGPGAYETEGHIDLPDGCVIQGVHRAVFVRPKPGFEVRNVFRMGSGCFIEGIIIENFRLDSLTNPTEGFAFSFRPGAVITRVPYAHKCAVRSAQPTGFTGGTLNPTSNPPNSGFPIGAGVALADGLVCSQYSIFPNIMTWGATPVSYNGIGYCAKNGGLINAVNAISMWSHKHFLAMSGGQIILSSCATQFGDYSLVSTGSRQIVIPREVSGNLTIQTASANLVSASRNTIVTNLWTALQSNNYTTGWTSSDKVYTDTDSEIWIRTVENMLRGGTSDMIERFQLVLFDTVGNFVFSNDKLNAFIYSYYWMRDRMIALPGMTAGAIEMITNATDAVVSTLQSPQKRLEPSRIEAIGHTWTANMIGVWAIKIPPAEARLPIRDSILEQSGGVVIATGQDSAGNALFAGDVTIDARFGMGGRGFIAPTKREATRAAITFGGF